MSEEEEAVNRGFILFPERNPYDMPFSDLVDYAKDQDFSVVRLDKLSEEEELDPGEYYHLLDRAVEALEEEGCNYIGAMGESMGAELLINYPGVENFEFMILWAPTEKLDEDKESFDGPVKIVHGSEDEEVDIERSERLVEAYPKAKFSKIEDVDHELGLKAVSKSESVFLSSRM